MVPSRLSSLCCANSLRTVNNSNSEETYGLPSSDGRRFFGIYTYIEEEKSPGQVRYCRLCTHLEIEETWLRLNSVALASV